MKSFLTAMSVMAVVIVAGLLAGQADAAREPEVPTIKKIMGTLHKGKASAGAVLKTALNADTPDWEKIKKSAKLFGTYGPALVKNDPPKGEKASFDKLATAYGKSSEALAKAAESEDIEGTKGAFAKIGSSCGACHKAHQKK